jgi:hypothetical protein
MSDDNPGRSAIEGPKRFPKNKIVRHAAKAAAGSVPYAGAVLSEIADASIPDREARDRRRWEGEVTHGVNDLHGRVDGLEQPGVRAVRFTGAAAEIATYLTKRCPDGLARDDVSKADLLAEFPQFDRDELLEGIGTLESYGLVTSMEFFNDEAIYTLTEAAYEALDPPIMGWNTRADAREVAALAATKRDYVMTHELEQTLGWPRRRFNPAHRLIVEMIDPGHVSDELQPNYVTLQFNPSNAELARLRRFAGDK